MPKLKITELKYHRNGVGGIGFTVARFNFTEDRKTYSAIATIFSNGKDDASFDGHCAVLVEDEHGKVDITSCWRGDHFESDLRRFIESDEGQVMIWPNLYPTIEAARAWRESA